LSTIVSAQTLHDAVREVPVGGTVDVGISGATPTRPLSALVSEADLVVLGIMDWAMSQLTRDETSVETLFDLRVISVGYRNEARIPLPAGAVINHLFVIDAGGRADIDGRTVVVHVDAPPLEVGPTYFLMLRKRDGDPFGTFRIVTSGAWEVRGRQVFAQRPLWLAEGRVFDGKDIDEFAQALWPSK
jgi:hypothetical protein